MVAFLVGKYAVNKTLRIYRRFCVDTSQFLRGTASQNPVLSQPTRAHRLGGLGQCLPNDNTRFRVRRTYATIAQANT